MKIRNLIKTAILLVIFCLLNTFCKVQGNNDDSANGFFKIYDDPGSLNDYSYYPVDIKPVSDQGYIILAYIQNRYLYLLKVNKVGEKEWEKRVETYDDPIPALHVGQDGYYFFCSPNFSSTPVLLKVKKDGDPNKEASFSGIPVSASFILGGKYLLMVRTSNYWEPTFIIYTPDAGEGKEYPYPNQCGYQDKKYHFTGKIKDEYFYYQTYAKTDTANENAFPDENSPCFKLRIKGLDVNPCECDINIPYIALILHNIPVPFSCDDLRVSGAIIQTGEGEENDNIVFIINEKINGIGRIDIINELSVNSPVDIKEMNIDNKDYVFFVGTTVFNTIKLYAYDKSDPLAQPWIKVFGEDSNYYAYVLIKTVDNGLAILGSLYMFSGSRICLIKLSEWDLKEMVSGN